MHDSCGREMSNDTAAGNMMATGYLQYPNTCSVYIDHSLEDQHIVVAGVWGLHTSSYLDLQQAARLLDGFLINSPQRSLPVPEELKLLAVRHLHLWHQWLWWWYT